MTSSSRPSGQKSVQEFLTAKAAEHGTLVPADEAAIAKVDARTWNIASGEDIVSQGERPDVVVFVLSGMLARYHTLPDGDRQYLSFHIAGDMPDVQSLFLDVMDHSVCALNQAVIATMPHTQLRDLLFKRPAVGFALWRMTLIDAAIFRQAITNNSGRGALARLAHFFCEQFYRAREAGLVEDRTCSLPMSQEQIGQTLGLSIVSINRRLQQLRQLTSVDFRAGELHVPRWPALSTVAGFDPMYLHIA